MPGKLIVAWRRPFHTMKAATMKELRRAATEGRLRYHRRFASKFLSTRRDVVVYLPPGYDVSSRTRYPVLYLQDGQNLFDPETAYGGTDWHIDLTTDELISNGSIQPLIIAGIYNAGVRRISEYTPTRDPTLKKGGKADRYAQMLTREVKPFIDTEYRSVKSARSTGVGGSSLGALAALQTGLSYPDVFGLLALMSPSVWWDSRVVLKMPDSFRSGSRPRIWLDVGTQEGSQPGEMLEDTRLLRTALETNGWKEGDSLYYGEFSGAAHNEGAWGERFGLVLKFLYGCASR
jgi:predicted alpha/beta superfamily hydrolase